MIGRERRLFVHRRLNPHEEKQLVVLDRPTERAAELVALQPVVAAKAAVLRTLKKADRVELVIAHEIEDIAVKIVRAGFRHRVDGGARRHAIAGVSDAALGPKIPDDERVVRREVRRRLLRGRLSGGAGSRQRHDDNTERCTNHGSIIARREPRP